MTLRRLQAFVGRFHRAGGRVLAGTDAPAFLVAPGFDYHRELELLEQSGLAREAVLEAATRSAAIALGRDDTVGRLLPGMAADLIIVDGDPIGGEHGIGVTRRVVLVAKDGRLLLDRLH